ncbi:MAG: biotin/lipoyl-binding protein, partial [Chromatocurvus sp.]
MHHATHAIRTAGTALLFLLAACGDKADTNADAPVQRSRSVPVTAAPLSYENLVTRLEAVGTSEALKSVSLYPEAAGEVVAVHFQPGDHVERDDTLLELESRDQKLALELAEVRLEETRRLYSRYDRANRSVDLTVPETTVDTARTVVSIRSPTSTSVMPTWPAKGAWTKRRSSATCARSRSMRAVSSAVRAVSTVVSGTVRSTLRLARSYRLYSR